MKKLNNLYSLLNIKFKLFAASLFILASNVYGTDGFSEAGEEAAPWEGPLNMILESLTGPIVRAIAIIAIVMAGLGLAFGEGGEGTKKILMIVLGISIAVGAAGIVGALFGFDGALVF